MTSHFGLGLYGNSGILSRQLGRSHPGISLGGRGDQTTAAHLGSGPLQIDSWPATEIAICCAQPASTSWGTERLTIGWTIAGNGPNPRGLGLGPPTLLEWRLKGFAALVIFVNVLLARQASSRGRNPSESESRSRRLRGLDLREQRPNRWTRHHPRQPASVPMKRVLR